MRHTKMNTFNHEAIAKTELLYTSGKRATKDFHFI